MNVSRGQSNGDLVEVFAPFEAGDVIVRRATDELREGTRVSTKPS